MRTRARRNQSALLVPVLLAVGLGGCGLLYLSGPPPLPQLERAGAVEGAIAVGANGFAALGAYGIGDRLGIYAQLHGYSEGEDFGREQLDGELGGFLHGRTSLLRGVVAGYLKAGRVGYAKPTTQEQALLFGGGLDLRGELILPYFAIGGGVRPHVLRFERQDPTLSETTPLVEPYLFVRLGPTVAHLDVYANWSLPLSKSHVVLPLPTVGVRLGGAFP